MPGEGVPGKGAGGGERERLEVSLWLAHSGRAARRPVSPELPQQEHHKK